MPKLLLIRGLPGSGKSTLAKEYVNKGYKHFEADMYFIDNEGNYQFQPSCIPSAHKWCQHKVWDELDNGNNVVVSNTFTQRWEIQPYKDMADELKCEFEVIECFGKYPNIHGVPDEAIQRMQKRWETLDF